MHERIAYTSLEETSTKRPLELGHPERVVRAEPTLRLRGERV